MVETGTRYMQLYVVKERGAVTAVLCSVYFGCSLHGTMIKPHPFVFTFKEG